MRIHTSIIIALTVIISCRKDCLETENCEPNNYNSLYIIEQNTPTATGTVYYIDSENGHKKK